MVYKPGAIPVGGQIKSQLGSGGGAEQRHGRRPDSQGVTGEDQLKKKRLFGRVKQRHGRPPRLRGPYHHIVTTRDRPQGLFYALSGGCSSQCYRRHSYRHLFIRLFCCHLARFCCLSCKTRRDLDEVARISPAPHCRGGKFPAKWGHRDDLRPLPRTIAQAC
jgi:hypothetical protein